MLVQANANVWSITVVGRADGKILVSPVNAPILIYQQILALLREHGRHVEPAVPAGV